MRPGEVPAGLKSFPSGYAPQSMTGFGTAAVDAGRGSLPAVDVVVLSWNRLEDTVDTLRSVLSQEAVEPRLWVVDQGSTTDTLAGLRSFSADHPNVGLVELDRNVGVPAGRNMGIRRGQAPWVVSLDNDAVLSTPHDLGRAVRHLAGSPWLGAVAFRAEEYHTGDLDATTWAYPSALQESDGSVPVARFVGVGHALRRAAFEAVGGYDERLFFCEEELDLSYRLIDRGYGILYDPAIVVRHKRSPQGRVRWDGERLYYQTRNAVLVHHRHHRRLVTTASVAAGWLFRAVYNRQARQALLGLRDAVRMWRHGEQGPPLGAAARRYIRTNDTRLRGSLPSRVRREVFAGLPGISDQEPGEP